MQDAVELVRWEDITKVRGARGDDQCRVDAGCVHGQSLHQPVREGGLSGRHPESAANGLKKKSDGRHAGEVRRVDDTLVDNDRNLTSETDADTADDLVSNPFSGAGVNLEHVDQTRADRLDDGCNDHEVSELAKHRDESTGQDGQQTDRQDERDVANAGIGRRDVFDGLEVDGQVVDHDEHGADYEEHVGAGDSDVAVLQDPEGNQSALARVPFDADEDDDEQSKADQRSDNRRVLPGFGDAAPLQSEQVTDHGGHNDEGAGQVHLQEFLFPRGHRRFGLGWGAEKE